MDHFWIGDLDKKWISFKSVVTVIIGILTAMALPRFANMTAQARLATHRKIIGDFKMGLQTIRAAWRARGSPVLGGNASSPVTLADGTVASVSNLGWAYSSGNYTAVPTDAQCVATMNVVLANPPQVVASNNSGCTDSICYVAVGSANTKCTYTLNGTAYYFMYNIENNGVITSG